MEIIKFEILKILRRKVFVATIIFSIAANIALLIDSKNDYDGWSSLFLHFGVWYLIGFIIIVGLSPVFSEEYSTGIDSLLLCCINGRKRLVTTKIVSSIIVIVSTTVLFMFMDLLFFNLYYNLSSIGSPIHTLKLFINSPYELSILQLLILVAFLKLLGSVAFGLLVLFVSSRSISSVLSLFISGIILYFPYITPITEDNYFYWIKEFSYERLLSVNYFFVVSKEYNILSCPVSYLNVMVIIFLILSGLFVYFTYFTYINRQVSEIIDED